MTGYHDRESSLGARKARVGGRLKELPVEVHASRLATPLGPELDLERLPPGPACRVALRPGPRLPSRRLHARWPTHTPTQVALPLRARSPRNTHSCLEPGAYSVQRTSFFPRFSAQRVAPDSPACHRVHRSLLFGRGGRTWQGRRGPALKLEGESCFAKSARRAQRAAAADLRGVEATRRWRLTRPSGRDVGI